MRIISEQELKDILDKHDKWTRLEYGGEVADLRDADLRDTYLVGANLRVAYLCGANLGGANLRGADLRGASLVGANLASANLVGAELGSANLRDTDLRGANLQGANLGGADLVVFQYNRDWAFFTVDGNLSIGCFGKSIGEWADTDMYDIGKKYRYTEQEIVVYGEFIKMCNAVFNKQNEQDTGATK